MALNSRTYSIVNWAFTFLKMNLADLIEEGNPRECFELLSMIGSGSYGAVWQAYSALTSEIVAVKRIPLESDTTALIHEIQLMKKLKHPNIVKYLGSFVDKVDDELWIILEFCSAGAVSDLMRGCHKTLTEEQCSYTLAATLLGLRYLHKQHVIHRDIKANNLLISEDAGVRIADFGVSAEMQNSFAQRNSIIGTPYWLSPQQIKGEPYGVKADVWALGITAIELTEGKPPHSELTSMRAIIVIPRQPPMKLKDRINPFTNQPHSDVFADFVDRCLQHAESDRATVDELLQHEFITMYCKIENDRIVSKSSLSTLIAERYKCAVTDVVVDGDSNQDDMDYDECGTMIMAPPEQHLPNPNFGTMVYEDGTVIMHGKVLRQGESSDVPVGTIVKSSSTDVPVGKGEIVIKVDENGEYETVTIVRVNSAPTDDVGVLSAEANVGTQVSVDVVETSKQEECTEDLDGPNAMPPAKTKESRGKATKGPKSHRGQLSRRQKIQAAAAKEYDQASQMAEEMTRDQLLVEKMTEKNPTRLRIIKKAILLTSVRAKSK